MAKQHRQTDAQWCKRIAEQQTSGLSVEAFCRAQGLASSTFFARRQRLREADRPEFIEVATEPANDQAVASAIETDAVPLELVLRGGVIVRVRPGFDAAVLRRVVDAIGGAT